MKKVIIECFIALAVVFAVMIVCGALFIIFPNAMPIITIILATLFAGVKTAKWLDNEVKKDD